MSRLVLPLAVVAAVMIGAVPAWAEPAAQRTFEDENWAEGLVDLRFLDLIRTDIVKNGYLGRGLQVNIPAGGFRGFGPYDRLPLPEPDEAWYRYYVRTLDWNSVSSGKLPGLSGIYSSSGKGCIRSEPGRPGWSARQLFGAAGTQGAPPGHVPIGIYVYHLDQPGDCGEGFYWPGASLEPGRWHCVEGRVRLNTPGQSNGRIDGWFDEKSVFEKDGMSFRRFDEGNIGIREMWLNVYFGGKFSTPNDLSLLIDEVEVSTIGRVGCLDPFLDDNDSIHEGALDELHALGFLNGCGYRLSCPKRPVTRGEIAALFSRIYGLEPATRDYFTDDDENIFEPGINRVRAAGIVFGCGSGEFCPDRELTRAEFAAMAIRSLGLEPSNSNVFTDDNGHWAEGAINSLAEAELTKGCAPGRYCPDRTLTRDEAAAFLVRMIKKFPSQTLSLASAESSIPWPPVGEPPPIPLEEQE